MAESLEGNWWNLPENLFCRLPCSLGTDSSAGFSSSKTPDDWNQEYFFGRSDADFSNMIIPEYSSNPISTSNEIFPLDSATSSLLQALFDSDDFDQPPHEFSPTLPETSPVIFPPFSQFANSILPSQSHVGQKKRGIEPAFKRARIQTPSPLPTFKVRKEKLGDRVTALQQLVSPFGKTDTASVLQEAIEYIRFLHDQVGVLSSPYLKGVEDAERVTDKGGLTQDLSGRGLCLVPISSTFPVTAETTVDFWAPIFRHGFE